MIASEKLWLWAAGGKESLQDTTRGGTTQTEDITQVAGLVIVWLFILGAMFVVG